MPETTRPINGGDDSTTGRSPRHVALRDEHREGGDHRYLTAYLDDNGNLHIDGQDLGPGTASVSSDGEYEWFSTIFADDIARVIRLLDGDPGADVLDLLERSWSGVRSYQLEHRLRESDIPIRRSVWRG